MHFVFCACAGGELSEGLHSSAHRPQEPRDRCSVVVVIIIIVFVFVFLVHDFSVLILHFVSILHLLLVVMLHILRLDRCGFV